MGKVWKQKKINRLIAWLTISSLALPLHMPTLKAMAAEDEMVSVSATPSNTTSSEETSDQTIWLRATASNASEQNFLEKETERKWQFIAYGPSINEKDNTYAIDDDKETVTVRSLNGKGKIQPLSNDGVAFYYTTIDAETENFELEATAVVNQWTFSNGQDGFGLMAADAIGKTAFSDKAVWNNTMMNMVSKVDYFWDPQKEAVSNRGDKITMKLGVGALIRTGMTKTNISYDNVGSLIKSVTKTLDTSCVELGEGIYNIVGNYTNTVAPTGTVAEPLTEFKLRLKRDNTGYCFEYDAPDGREVTYYDLDREALTQIEDEVIYLGFFAARNADITFKDIHLNIIDPEEDELAEESDVEYVEPIYTVTSPGAVGVKDYNFGFRANADGILSVKFANVFILNAVAVTADEEVSCPVELTGMDNVFHVTFTPDIDYVPGEYELLTSYEQADFDFNVLYQVYGKEGQSLYVSPEGTADGQGNKQSPLDIYTAVKYVQPGQRIVLSGGTYQLTKPVKVERGIDGTEENMIYMYADPDSNNRPVLDFGRQSIGMVLSGNYWYFKGFDVTHTQDSQKGIQLTGSHCVLDGINTYENGNTGVQISRLNDADGRDKWPAYNLILNCTSYNNADKGYEDADGFAAKLTIGDGNVFDGCIAYNNADDGWDLFAKAETGSIGKVVVQNSIAYNNGYLLDGTDAGNGNGFKLGGSSLSGKHELINCVSYNNKAKGIDSNSCPDIKVINCITFNNESYNVAFYTTDASNTDFEADGVISFRTENLTINENIKPVGKQVLDKIYKVTDYYWSSGKSANIEGVEVQASWFVNLDTSTSPTRNDDGTIERHGVLELSDKAPLDAGARPEYQPSYEIETSDYPAYVDEENTGDDDTDKEDLDPGTTDPGNDNQSSSSSSSSSGSSGGGAAGRGVSSTNMGDTTGTWQSDIFGIWYQKQDGSYPANEWLLINGKWYFFNPDGYALIGWQLVNGKWYYLGTDYAMLTGWVFNTDGKWYYLSADGSMAVNTETPDGYRVNENGEWVIVD